MKFLKLLIPCLLSGTLTAQTIEFVPYLAGDVKDAKTSVAKVAAARSQHWTHPMIWDHGILEAGSPAVSYFKFINTGDQPLIIQAALASCGCAYAEHSREPILPGEVGYIYVHYHNKLIRGAMRSAVTVRSNATNQPVVGLRIRGLFQKE